MESIVKRECPVATEPLDFSRSTNFSDLVEAIREALARLEYPVVVVFHPDEKPSADGSRMVIRIETDTDYPMLDLLVKPINAEAFIYGRPLATTALALETSYRSPRRVEPHMQGHFDLVERLTPIFNQVFGLLQEQLD